MKPDFQGRIDRAARQAADSGLSGILVTPGPDLTYFTGYQPTAITERITMLVIDAHGSASIVVPQLERPDLDLAAHGAGAAWDVLTWSDGQDEYAVTARLLNRAGHYAVSDSAWALHVLGLQHALPGSRYTSMTRALPMLRAVKGTDEIMSLAAAGAAADAVFGDILHVQFEGRREADVAHDLAQFLRDHGHSQVDFTVVGSGPNGANPHHEAGHRIISAGDMVVLDFGGLLQGYGSDTTRTVHVGPDISAEQQEVFDVVRRAQQAGFEAVRPGATCQDVDRAARAVITDAGYGEFFVHRAGHGIGITTHEPPYMVEGEQSPIVAGMCFSVEPGIYLPGRFGVRIEDIVVAFPPDTPAAGRRLNNSDHCLAIVS